MTDYTKLVAALRCKRDDCEGCGLAFFDKDEGWMCRYAAKDDDAADAIEALQAKLPKRGDMVEVVRCGECKWLFNDSNTFFKPCEVIIPEKDWYCAYGERKAKMEAQE